MDEKIANIGRKQLFRTPIQRMALADAAEIELDTRLPELHGLVLGVEFDQAAADAGQCLGQLFVGGDGSGTSGKSPDLRERPGGDLKRPVRLGTQPHGQPQQVEQSLFDFDRPAGRGAIDVADIAGLAEDRHLIFQGFDQIEGLDGDLRAVLVLAGAQTYLELAGHRPTRDADQVRGTGGGLRLVLRVLFWRHFLDRVGHGVGGRLASEKVTAAALAFHGRRKSSVFNSTSSASPARAISGPLTWRPARTHAWIFSPGTPNSFANSWSMSVSN